MRISRRSLLLSGLTLLHALNTLALEPGWGTEPVERLSPTRARICLNGLWSFTPDAGRDAPDADSPEWGLIHVPGAWANSHWSMQIRKSIHENGQGERWKIPDWKALESAWYRRRLHIPGDWEGSRVLLNLSRVSTDAVVFVDGKPAGEIRWPNGKVDLTNLVKPGGESELTLQVIATASTEPVLNFMATADSQVTAEEARLNHRGLIGEVFLEKRPKGAHVEDLFVQPSVREKQLTLDLRINGLSQPSAVNLSLRILDADGDLALEQKRTETLSPDAVFSWSVPWQDPKLWDFGHPHLYTLEVTVSGDNIQDVFTQRFGFKEFWIEGRQFFLNGRPVNLRPLKVFDGHATGNVEIIRTHIRRYMEMGFNVGELWPSDHLERGMGHYRKLWKEIADEEGFGLIATLPRSNQYIMDSRWRNVWEENREQYAKDVMPELIAFRNHPSVLYWVNSANFFGHHQDQNPRHLGRSMEVTESWHQKEAAGLEAISFIKQSDPTRPVATHQGAQVGDVFMTNFYLNMLPLQDRMEWLSDYMENGTMPFMPVEMGTPLDCTFRRGRNGFSNNTRSEPLMTEYLAIYQGPDAYLSEPAAYRKDLKDTFEGGQKYGWWQNKDSKISAPGFQKLQSLFTQHTYRSWRTWGNSAGMIAWADAHGWTRGPGSDERISSTEPFRPGHRGTWLPSISKWKTRPFDEAGGWIQLPAGQTFIQNNQPTLAWIAGAPEAFTERSHLFASSSTLRKQVVLLNDDTTEVPFDLQWTAEVGGVLLASGSERGNVSPTGNLRFPLEVDLPEVLSKTDGRLRIRARMGSRIHLDEFEFRVFPAPASMTVSARLEDPKALTAQMLQDLNIGLSEAENDMPSLLIVGRQALGTSRGLPPEAQKVINAGGTVLVMIQERDWYRRVLGFRVADPISRQVFPVQADHPVLAGLDARDLRNWNGEATLIDPYPVLTRPDTKLGAYGVPYHGWRWGSRGAVSSAMMEKPHYSGWTPILQGEFDLAYSPLMELYVNEGRILLCSLDVEDLAKYDPAAAQLTRQLLQYAATPRTSPRRPTTYVGAEPLADELNAAGLQFSRSDTLPAAPGLLLVGPDSGLEREALEAFSREGGQVLVLPQRGGDPLVPLRSHQQAGAALQIPGWPELRGISIADIRTRAPTPLMTLSALEGVELGVTGLLGRQKTETGALLFTQLDPAALKADTNTYLRFTRWRFTRARSQLIANLGGQFEQDLRIFQTLEAPPPPVSLAGDWQLKLLKEIPDPDQEPHGDPGISEQAKALLNAGGKLDGTANIKVPGKIPPFDTVNGEAVMQRTFILPKALAAQDLVLRLGTVDDNETTYINGKEIGSTQGWNIPRIYPVPAAVLKEGENLIQVRIWDNFGGGGTAGTPAQFRIGLPEQQPGRSLYHADYLEDFPMGDDPYRYYRW